MPRPTGRSLPEVRLNKAGRYPFLDQRYAIGIASGTIRRSEFGMSYGEGWVDEDIRLVIGFEAIGQE